MSYTTSWAQSAGVFDRCFLANLRRLLRHCTPLSDLSSFFCALCPLSASLLIAVFLIIFFLSPSTHPLNEFGEKVIMKERFAKTWKHHTQQPPLMGYSSELHVWLTRGWRAADAQIADHCFYFERLKFIYPLNVLYSFYISFKCHILLVHIL